MVVKGELVADSTASRKLFPPDDFSWTPAEATASRKLFPLVGLTLQPGSLVGGFAEELTKEVSLIDFTEPANSLPKVVSLIGLTEEHCPLPGGDMAEEPLPGGDLTKETCPLLGGDLDDLTKELVVFFTVGSSRKLLPLEAPGFDLIIIHVIFATIAIISTISIFKYTFFFNFELVHLGFVISWLPWLLVGESAFPRS